MDTISDKNIMKIDDQPKWYIQQLKIAHDFGFVDSINALDRFYFNQ